MRIEQLRIRGLRCLSEVDVSLAAGVNVFVGNNGAGKTSVLEAAFLLSHARSFRAGAKDALLQRGASQLSVYAELSHADGHHSRVGLGRESQRWEAKVDGDNVTIGRLVGACAVVCFEPGSHALIAGPADERRRYLDWGVFHVEHEFLTLWRRYQRALKQRNSLLRSGVMPTSDLFDPWEVELAQSAERIDGYRAAYVEKLRPKLHASINGVLAELGLPQLRYRRGWPEGESLLKLLRDSRGRDMGRGHTTLGPHRADWMISFEHAPLREHLSRGQEKLAALSCVLAQAALHAECNGEWPVVCLDDLASELDQTHQAAVVSQLVSAGAQVLLTGTDTPEALKSTAVQMFHVEQGVVSRLL